MTTQNQKIEKRFTCSKCKEALNFEEMLNHSYGVFEV